MADKETARALTAQDLLAGGKLVHDVCIPPEILTPGGMDGGGAGASLVRLRPLNVAMLALISRAARDDAGLVPLLMIKEALVEPMLSLDQVRQLHIGLVHYLVGQINVISGLTAEGDTFAQAASSPTGQAYLLLAKHFGWTPEQVSQLTPGQVAIYLAGVQALLQYEEKRK